MAIRSSSTLVEVHLELRKACFAVLNSLYSESWTDISQVVYSTASDWETGYYSYLNNNRVDTVKLPFATLTRGSTQESFAHFNSPLPVYRTGTTDVVAGGEIRQVKCEFTLKVYEKQFNFLEDIINLIIVSGNESQRFAYFSEILQADAQISFRFLEPQHDMIPDKTNKVEGNGYIYGVEIPIEVDCVLGIPKEQKLIKQIIKDTFIDDQLIRTDIIE